MLPQVQRVYAYLWSSPGKSAWQIATALGLKSASVSSLLKRMTDDGRVSRRPGRGPGGGYTYTVRASR